MDNSLERKLEKRASIYSIVLVLVASITKTVMIFFTNSVSYRGEFMDSIIDIAVVALTFISLRLSRKPADADHMFGHYKINSFMGIVESFLTMGLYGYILYSAIVALINYDVYMVDNPLGSIFSLMGIIAINIFISTQIVRIGKKLNNSVIKAQGVNFRGDLIRNIAVIGALIGAYFNINIIDPILAILAVGYAYYESIKIIRVSFNELIDYNAVDPDRIEKVKEFMLNTPEVAAIDHFAARTAGRKLDLSARIFLESEKFLSNSLEITNTIKNHIENQFNDYDINSFIEISTYHNIDGDTLEISDVFDKIRRLSGKFPLILDIHHLSIDRLEDTALIHFHVNVNQNETLSKVHEIVSQLEDQIESTLSEIFPGVPTEIISHIEPTENLEITQQAKSSPKRELLEKKIVEIINQNPDILDYKLMRILEELDGFLLSIIIYLHGELPIYRAHLIAETLELSVKKIIPELNNCIIHTEPIDENKEV
jgi:cation diffusion facilitator family transporter